MKTTKLLEIAREKEFEIHICEDVIVGYKVTEATYVSFAIPNVAEISAYIWDRIKGLFGF